MEFPVTLLLTGLTACLTASGRAQLYQHQGPRGYVPAPLGHDGRVVDTPEVAQAKAAHLAAYSRLAAVRQPGPAAAATHYHLASSGGGPEHHYAAAAAAAAVPASYGGPLHGAYSSPGHFSSRVQHGQYGYRGPPAPLAHDGRVLDTPEVAQAKAAHFAAFSQAATRAHENPAAPFGHHQYHRHQEQSSGDDYDTGAYRAGPDDEGSYSEDDGRYEGHANAPYQGPPAPLAEDGRVVDTPEVAQAKAAHIAALQQASHHGYYPAPRGPGAAAGHYYLDY